VLPSRCHNRGPNTVMVACLEAMTPIVRGERPRPIPRPRRKQPDTGQQRRSSLRASEGFVGRGKRASSSPAHPANPPAIWRKKAARRVVRHRSTMLTTTTPRGFVASAMRHRRRMMLARNDAAASYAEHEERDNTTPAPVERASSSSLNLPRASGRRDARRERRRGSRCRADPVVVV